MTPEALREIEALCKMVKMPFDPSNPIKSLKAVTEKLHKYYGFGY